MLREIGFGCSAVQKHIKSYKNKSRRANLPNLKLLVLPLLALMAVAPSAAMTTCTTFPDSCIGGTCTSLVMPTWEMNVCMCDYRCSGKEPETKLCDRIHNKEFKNHCDLMKQRCLHQIDYRATKSQCNDGNVGNYDWNENCVNHYCKFGYAIQDDDGNCACSCHSNYEGARCESRMLRILRKIMKRSVD